MDQRGYDASTWMCKTVPHPKQSDYSSSGVFALKVSKLYDDMMMDMVIINRVISNITVLNMQHDFILFIYLFIFGSLLNAFFVCSQLSFPIVKHQ